MNWCFSSVNFTFWTQIISNNGSRIFEMPSLNCNEELERRVMEGSTEPVATISYHKGKLPLIVCRSDIVNMVFICGNILEINYMNSKINITETIKLQVHGKVNPLRFPAQTGRCRPVVVCFIFFFNFDTFGKYLNESCREHSIE